MELFQGFSQWTFCDETSVQAVQASFKRRTSVTFGFVTRGILLDADAVRNALLRALHFSQALRPFSSRRALGPRFKL